MLESFSDKERKKLLNRKEAAEFLGVKPNTLANWTCTHRYRLPYIKIGKLVKYRLSDLEAFIEENSKLRKE